MERKTLGSFIAVLRKASGMTQKELAQKLNVSDKAVSRWERDESAPDLTLIPVIADIFGVTSDELLRGERSQRETEEIFSQKSQKQLDYILERNAMKFKVQSIICSGVALIGLIAAMLFDFALARTDVGVLCAYVLYLAAAIGETACSVFAFFAINSNEFDEKKLASHKAKLKKMILITAFIIAVCAVSTAFLPIGLYFWTYIIPAVTFGIAALCFLGKWAKAKRSEITDEKEFYKTKLRVTTASATAAIIALTIVGHVCFFGVVGCENFSDGTVHSSFEEFKEYMETPSDKSLSWERDVYLALQNSVEDGTDYAQEWQDILDQNMDFIELQDSGEMLYYSHINQDVNGIFFGDADNGYLPITTYTAEQFIEGYQKRNLFHFAFAALYAAEFAAGLLFFKKKIKQKGL